MSPSGRTEDILTTSGTFQSNGYTHQDDESQYEWKDLLCIKLNDNGFVTIDIESSEVDYRKFDSIFGPSFEDTGIFWKMRTGMKPGSMWTKMFEWDFEDYDAVLNNEYIMNRLENNITPNPTYIDEMKAIKTAMHRDLQIDKVIDNT